MMNLNSNKKNTPINLTDIRWIELLKNLSQDKSFYNRSSHNWVEIRFNKCYSEFKEIKRDENEIILFSADRNFYLKIDQSLYFGFDMAESWINEQSKHYGVEYGELIDKLNRPPYLSIIQDYKKQISNLDETRQMNVIYIDSIVKSSIIDSDFVNSQQLLKKIRFESIDLFKFHLKSDKKNQFDGIEKMPLNEINDMVTWLNVVDSKIEPSFSIIKAIYLLAMNDKMNALEAVKSGITHIATMARPLTLISGVKTALAFDSAIDGVISLVCTLIKSDYTPHGNVKTCLTSFSYIGCLYENMIGALFDFGDMNLNDFFKITDSTNTSRHQLLIEPLRQFFISSLNSSIYFGLGQSETAIRFYSETLCSLNMLISNFIRLFFEEFEKSAEIQNALEIIYSIQQTKLKSLINGCITPYKPENQRLIISVFNKYKINTDIDENNQSSLVAQNTIIEVDDNVKFLQQQDETSSIIRKETMKSKTRRTIHGIFILFLNILTFIVILYIMFLLFND